MAQTLLFANIAELSALNVFTFLSSRFTEVSVPFKVIVPKTNQLTCHSFAGDLYLRYYMTGYRKSSGFCNMMCPVLAMA